MRLRKQSILQMLSSRPERTVNSVLSVYLDADQSRQANLNRGFEKELKNMLASLRNTIEELPELDRFRSAAHHMEDFVSSYQPGARAIVMFFDETDGFFWHEEIQGPVNNQIRWNRELFLEPLAAAADESESYGIALAGRASLRLFVAADEIEELIDETFPSRQVRHLKTIGTDHIGSASQAQRKADERIRWNLRHIVRDIDWLLQSKQLQRVLLAGTPEITAELSNLLPRRLASQVIGTMDVSTDAPAERLLAAAQPIVEKYERESELRLVDQVVTEAAKGRKAVTGLSRTLNAVNQGRVWQLLYSVEFHSPGFECSKCAALFSVERESCLYCSAEVRSVTDVVERAIEHALRKGAKIEVVKDEASESLINAGGIGAFLRARTASILV
jgi:peptide subunit release factor 1 (eRF1)